MKNLFGLAFKRLWENLSSKQTGLSFRQRKTAAERLGVWVDSKEFCRSDQCMADVAEELGVSKDELSWMCHLVYGESFQSVRKRLRIKEAIRLMCEFPSVPLTLIAERVGIGDKSNFRRQFYEVYGHTIMEWRESSGRG